MCLQPSLPTPLCEEFIHNSPVGFGELPFLHLLFVPIKGVEICSICRGFTDYHRQTEPPLSKNWDFGALNSWTQVFIVLILHFVSGGCKFTIYEQEPVLELISINPNRSYTLSSVLGQHYHKVLM